MFYSHLINIKPADVVLEIGPGAYPHWRSDCLVDRFEDLPTTDISQFGGAHQQTLGKPLFLVDGPHLPFRDNTFDYLICAQVLEHVSHEELPVLVSEINRVTRRAYIEVPRPVFDLVYDFDVHLNLMDIVEDTIVCLPKKRTSLRKVKLLTKHALELRKLQGFAIENISVNAVAVGKEFVTPLRLKICDDEEEFFILVSGNIINIPPPSRVKKIKEHFARLTYKYSYHQSKVDINALLVDA